MRMEVATSQKIMELEIRLEKQREDIDRLAHRAEQDRAFYAERLGELDELRKRLDRALGDGWGEEDGDDLEWGVQPKTVVALETELIHKFDAFNTEISKLWGHVDMSKDRLARLEAPER